MKNDHLHDHLKHLERHGNEKILANIKQILTNIIEFQDPKYRTLRFSNSCIKEIIDGGHLDILYKAGFLKKNIEFQECLIYKDTVINMCKIKDTLKDLNEKCFDFKHPHEVKLVKNWQDIKSDLKKQDDYHKTLVKMAEEDRLIKLEKEDRNNEKIKRFQMEQKRVLLEKNSITRSMTRGFLNYLDKNKNM